jgi:uncharacterized delta-60 repeat protein
MAPRIAQDTITVEVMKTFTQVCTLAVLLLTQAGTAGAGLLDPSFNPGSGANNPINAMARQPDGRIVVVGSFTEFDGISRNRIARLNADGSLDSDFDPGTGADDNIEAVLIQPDGRIVIAGFFTALNGISRNGIARLNPDGSLDTNFDPGIGVGTLVSHPQVHTVALDADGKIIIGGYFTEVNGVSRNGIARLNADGSVDSSFNPGTGLEGFVALALATQTNRQVLVAGIFERINGVPRKSIARLNVDGSVDASFSVPQGGIGGSNALERVFALAVQPDGRIIIGGDFTIVAGARRQHVARLNADGSLDTTFDPGIIYLQRVTALALQPDGRVVIGGNFTSIDSVSRNSMARLMSDGSLDLGFDPGSGVEVPAFSSSEAFVSSLALQPDGRVLLAGNFETFDGVARKNIARVERGSDTNLVILNFAPFPINRAVDEDAGAAVITINRIGSHDSVVTVDYATAEGTAKAGEDYSAQSGTITFGVGERSKIISIPLAEDALPEDNESFAVVLMNPSGGAMIGSAGTLEVTVQDDDSGVEFSAATYEANELKRNVTITVRRVGRIEPWGRVPATFTVDFATSNGTATAGQDYIAQSGTLRFGYFLNDWERTKTFSVPILDDTLVEGSETILLTLSNPSDGVILGALSNATVVIADNEPGRGANDPVQVMLPLSDGKVVIGGDFTFVDGTARNRLARLNANTTLDSGFNPGTGADGTVFALALQSGGKVLLGGSFTNVNGLARRGIARINSNGSLDPTFDPGIGVQASSHGVRATVKSIVVQTNGQILIGGFFSECGGLPRDGIARLNSDGSLDAEFNPSYGQDAVFPMALQSDGKILAGGYFKLAGFVVAFARLNIDGSVDESFRLGAGELGLAHVTGIVSQNDGKILTLGRFVFNGTNRDVLGVLRFNDDGSVDPSYLSTNVLAGYPNTFVSQPDGKVFVGGRAANVAAIDWDGLVRLEPDGVFDAAFDPKIGPEGEVFAVAVQPSGTIVIGGSFRTVNGLPRYRIAQLNADGSVVGSVIFNPPEPVHDGRVRLSTQNAPGMEQIVEASTNLTDWVPIYTNKAPMNSLQFIDADAGLFRQRFYRVVTRP